MEDLVSPEVVKAMRTAFEQRKCPVYLFGNPGCGKSFAAALVYVRWTGTVSFWRYCDLVSDAIEADKFGEIHRTLDNGAIVDMTKSAFWKWLENLSLLIVDDLGTGASGEWKREIVWKLLEVRAGKPLLMTGNIGPNAIAKEFDDSIRSRIMAGTPIMIEGSDRRLVGVESRIRRVKTN